MSNVFSDGELAEMQAAHLAIMDLEAVIWRYTTIADGRGGTTVTYVNGGTTPCRVGSPGDGVQQERGEYITLGTGVVVKVFVPVDTVLVLHDRLVVDNMTLEVLEDRDYGSYAVVNTYGMARVIL